MKARVVTEGHFYIGRTATSKGKVTEFQRKTGTSSEMKVGREIHEAGHVPEKLGTTEKTEMTERGGEKGPEEGVK